MRRQAERDERVELLRRQLTRRMMCACASVPYRCRHVAHEQHVRFVHTHTMRTCADYMCTCGWNVGGGHIWAWGCGDNVDASCPPAQVLASHHTYHT